MSDASHLSPVIMFYEWCRLNNATDDSNLTLRDSAASPTDSEQIPPMREVKVVDVGIRTFKLAWKRTPGVSRYKVSWSSFHGMLQRLSETCTLRVYHSDSVSAMLIPDSISHFAKSLC